MLRAMYSGVSGMRSFQLKLDVVGNNVANVNTPGFKGSRVLFQDVVNQTLSGASAPNQNTLGGVNPRQVGLGVAATTIDTIFQQGTPQSTNNPTDLYINGDGFFVVTDGVNRFLTRSGDFRLDSQGFLVNGQGLKLVGVDGQVIQLHPDTVSYSIGSDGVIRTIKVTETVGKLRTAEAKFDGGNIEITRTGTGGTNNFYYVQGFSNEDPPVIGTTYADWAAKFTSTSLNTVNFSGTPPTFSLTPTDERFITIVEVEGDVIVGFQVFPINAEVVEEPSTPVLLDPGTNEGSQKISLVSPNSDNRYFYAVTDYPWNPPVAGTSRADFNAFYNNLFPDINEIVNGEADNIVANPGQYISIVEVDANGDIVGFQTMEVPHRIGLLFVNNAPGLEKVGNTLYVPTANTVPSNFEDARLVMPGTGGTGALSPGFLEMSNVELTAEFTEMIIAQRGFQANSRIITTSDEILQEVVNLKR